MTSAKITILGCGNSTGVPAVGNYWGQCDPKEPKNRRTRSSILIETDQTRIVIDTGPDFREQLNREDISTLDSVFYTHAHSDHVNGIDDLRAISFRNQGDLPVFGNADTINELKTRFPHVFDGGNSALYPPLVQPQIIQNSDYHKPQTFKDLTFTPFPQDHETCITCGYRFGSFAYSLDFVRMPDDSIETLKGVETWIVDAAAYKMETHSVHASLKTIYDLNKIIGAKTVILSTLSLDMDYQTLIKELPSGYLPAYDGQTLNLAL